MAWSKRKIERTIRKLTKACDAYYNTSEPIMTDAEFDELYHAAKAEAPDHEFFTGIGAAPADNALAKVKHAIQMTSLTNAFTKDDMKKFVSRSDAGLIA